MKHGIDCHEVETVFYDDNLLILGEQYYPEVNEDRYGIIGKSITRQIVFICFTLRDDKVRPISSRVANKKERIIYG